MDLITSLFANVFRLAEMELDDDREKVVRFPRLIMTKKNILNLEAV